MWDAFFAFYMETGSRKWGRPYLTRDFFSVVGEKMRDRILLVRITSYNVCYTKLLRLSIIGFCAVLFTFFGVNLLLKGYHSFK